MPTAIGPMPQSTIRTASMSMTTIPVSTFRVQTLPANSRGWNSQRVSLGPQKELRSMVGRADGQYVYLLRIDFITECMI